MAFSLASTWLGIGLKTGGILFVVGAENTEGMLFNAANVSHRAGFSLTNARLGAGLGGGSGLVALCVFNCQHARQLNGQANDDWGVSIALGERWDAVVRTLRGYRFFQTVARIGPRLRNMEPENIETVRNGLHYLYNAYDVASMGNGPKIISLDTPASLGVELSVSYSTGGRIEIY